jgi:hypothetical protein
MRRRAFMNNCTLKKTKHGLKVVTFKQGYQVSIKDLFTTTNPESYNLKSFMTDAKRLYMGVWKNPDNGLTYVDLSIHTMSLKNALEIGKKHNQICIYDWQHDRVLS